MRKSLALLMALAVLAAAAAQTRLGPPVNLGPAVNSPFDEGSPSVTADGLELYFSSNRPGGHGAFDLWVSTRADPREPWGPAANLGPVVNGPAIELAPTVTGDGLELVFSDYVMQREGGQGKADLWIVRRASRNSPWGKPENLGPLVNGPEDEITPTFSVDGLELVFDSYRPGGLGFSDLWASRRASRSESFGAPVWLGDALNGPGIEHCPTLSADGLVMLFDWTPAAGSGGGQEVGDLMLAARTSRDAPWGAPTNLGHEHSTHYAAALSADGRFLYLSSDRAGGQGEGDLWMCELVPAVAAR